MKNKTSFNNHASKAIDKALNQVPENPNQDDERSKVFRDMGTYGRAFYKEKEDGSIERIKPSKVFN